MIGGLIKYTKPWKFEYILAMTKTTKTRWKPIGIIGVNLIYMHLNIES